ncbi:MAG TPA: CoA pyrophosphatase [Candidatus Dormibacteraeota bacterium]|nr:CoA pyrophosphatase [Candidatus Dormibacteraeota bacterium]
MTGFLARTERLFSPVDAWGEFRRGARPAAVTFILYTDPDGWKVPFVRRRADLPDHPGQVALPGGGVRAGETAWEAAQREVAEEIGVPVGRLQPLGAGEPIYAAVSNFSVVPFVAHLPDPVPAFVHDERELDGVLEIPLDRLLDDSAWLTSGAPWRFRYLAHQESVVWGLTERIVAGLAPRLRQALSESGPAGG